jgi:hypothetical protein
MPRVRELTSFCQIIVVAVFETYFVLSENCRSGIGNLIIRIFGWLKTTVARNVNGSFPPGIAALPVNKRQPRDRFKIRV